MNHLPTTKQLRYFVALEQIGHFGKAADTCFVSQPAFSVAIRELENTLNIQLVDRTNKNVTVTSLGRDIARQARQVLRDLEELVDIDGAVEARGHSYYCTFPIAAAFTRVAQILSRSKALSQRGSY